MQATIKFKKFELHDYATRHSELMLWGWDSQQTPWRQGQKQYRPSLAPCEWLVLVAQQHTAAKISTRIN